MSSVERLGTEFIMFFTGHSKDSGVDDNDPGPRSGKDPFALGLRVVGPPRKRGTRNHKQKKQRRESFGSKGGNV